MAATETVQSTELKIFTIQAFTENVSYSYVKCHDDLRNVIKLLNLFSTDLTEISLIFSLFCQLAFLQAFCSA